MQVYKCHYRLQKRHQVIVISGKDMMELKRNGLWLTGTHDLATNYDNRKFWVPPSQIEYIEVTEAYKV